MTDDGRAVVAAGLVAYALRTEAAASARLDGGDVGTVSVEGPKSDLAAFQREVGEWGRATFPESDPVSIVRHLSEEAGELVEAVFRYTGCQTAWACETDLRSSTEEAADCLLLLLNLAHQLGFDLMAAAQAKLAVNRTRTWKPAAGGYWKHELSTTPPPAGADEGA